MSHGLAALAALTAAYTPPSHLVQHPTTSLTQRCASCNLLAAREERLHRIARTALLEGNTEDAKQCYEKACNTWGSGRSFLLAALLYSNHLGDTPAAREYFAQGILKNREDATLMQAWGLFESKHGPSHRALQLLKRAVQLDPDKRQVLNWKRFRTADVVMQHPTAAAPEEVGKLTATPRIRYTVKMANRGWKGRESAGEDPTSWYDNEGKRNGPPTNYWRQALDERLHRNCVDAMLAVVASGPSDGSSLAEEGLEPLEYKMGISTPRKNRKLLGKWAPLLVNGKRLATPIECDSASLGATAPSERERAGLLVPATVTIARSGERKTFEHRYGVFDEHMDEGEGLTVTLELTDADGASEEYAAPLEASGENTRVAVGGLPQLPNGEMLFVGNIVYLNEYMLVGRDESGRLTELFMRVDDEEALPPQ